MITTGIGSLTVVLGLLIAIQPSTSDRKDFKVPLGNLTGKANACIARFESGTGEPLYYSCPKQNENSTKIYCCYLDKCCDYKEYQRQTEHQFKMRQASNYKQVIDKGAIGKALKWILGLVFAVIVFIVGCSVMLFVVCKKKKMFTGGIFNSPLPPQPPGPSPYAPPTRPYVAYQWPPEFVGPQPPPAYQTRSVYSNTNGSSAIFK